MEQSGNRTPIISEQSDYTAKPKPQRRLWRPMPVPMAMLMVPHSSPMLWLCPCPCHGHGALCLWAWAMAMPSSIILNHIDGIGDAS